MEESLAQNPQPVNPKGSQQVKAILLIALTLGAASAAEIQQSGPAQAKPAIVQHSKTDCKKIVTEIKRQHGSVQAQKYLGTFVAWRESGCSLQCVSNRTDHSCSRFGLNFKGTMGQFWGKLCGAWNRSATKALAVDVKCALRAFTKYGTRPWRT